VYLFQFATVFELQKFVFVPGAISPGGEPNI